MNFVILIAFGLDALFGDPAYIPHPVSMIGKLITKTEKYLRQRIPDEVRAGAYLVAIVCSISFFVPLIILAVLHAFNPWVALAVDIFFCFQILAAKSLKTAALRVFDAVSCGKPNEARKALSHIVGRDTKNLDRDGVIKATIETVSENTTDGVVAPLFYMAIGGAPLAFMYKAINTMDSMIGYKNDKYLLFGKCAAKVDDLANFLPARIAALLMIAASAFLSLDPKNAFKIYIRDHKKHASPNSAHTEAACAGALGIQLGGDATYDGVVVHRHTIGNSLRPVQTSDIKRAIQLMYLTSILMLIFSII